jgi:sn-glycerol 3-phosphate transport system permease protein
VSATNTFYTNLWNPALKGWDAFALIVIASSWKMIAYSFIFFLAGLQSIPRTITEAAAMDGAGVLRRMRDLQFPLLAPTFFFLLVINITESSVDSFGIVDIITGGGPARATDLMVFKINSDGFRGLDSALAAAQSIVLMTLVLMNLVVTLTFTQFKYVEKRVHHS